MMHHFVDIKLNIIYIDKNRNPKMIVEAQQELIDNLKNQVYSIDAHYQNIKIKLDAYIRNLW